MFAKKYVVLIALLTISVIAQEPVSLQPPPSKDLFVGIWKSNPNKSRPKLGKKDRMYERVITREGNELVFSSRTENPQPSANNYHVACDGKPHRVPFGFLECEYTAANRVEGVTHASDESIDYWAREVSDDGREMRVIAYKDEKRTKLKSVWVLDRTK